MEHLITAVEPGSPAERHGLEAGDRLCAINGEAIVDEIDYQALIASSRMQLQLIRKDGREETLTLRKREEEPLGLRFGPSMTLSPRTCRNKCAFCFIDQMPKGLRDTLYVKDDDWRLSLMMGNFITMTNISDEEFDGWLALADTFAPEGKPSMRQDGEAHRKSEVELFAGTMVRLAKKHGADVPVNRWLYDRVRQMEAQYE